MKIGYPLKKSEACNFVEPLMKYLEQGNQILEGGSAIRDSLIQINQLRNKVCSLEVGNNIEMETVNKYIIVIETYVRYCRLIAKHFNWNPVQGEVVRNVNIIWYDTFSGRKFMKSEIHFDIFCCFYNLGVLYLYKAGSRCYDDIQSAMKQAIQFSKRANYYINQIKTVYYSGFINTGFDDTNYQHLQMLQYLSLGIIYKCMYELFKQNQYKIGINKIATLALFTQINFYKVYQLGIQIYGRSSNLCKNLKSEILSFAYVESLYYDVVGNAKYAKYYENQMETNKDNIALLIGYQRKALRLVNLGLTNQSVVDLLNQRASQKKQLQKLKSGLESTLNTNMKRNAQIYKRQEIPEEKLPSHQLPKQYLIKLVQPKQIGIEYDSKNAKVFLKIGNNQSKEFIKQLKNFSGKRLSGLEQSHTKLQKNVENIYNDTYVNYYLNLQNSNKQKKIPQTLKRKLTQIRVNGGKTRLQKQIDLIKKNSVKSHECFESLRKMLEEQAIFDGNKRQQYGRLWRRQTSQVAQGFLNMYETKAKQAESINKELITKYEQLHQFIELSQRNQTQILSAIPQVEVTKFIEENRQKLQELKSRTEQVKIQMQGINSVVDEIRNGINKMDYSVIAMQFEMLSDEQERMEFIEKINSFNNKGKGIEENARKIGEIARSLNSKSGGNQSSRKQFQVFIGKFNRINDLFRQLLQGGAFYIKLSQVFNKINSEIEQFVTVRRIEAQELENSISKKGRPNNLISPPHRGTNLPNMYPNQQAKEGPGFYIPPTSSFGSMANQNPYEKESNNNNNEDNFSGMLSDLINTKPTFNENLFTPENKVYMSKYK